MLQLADISMFNALQESDGNSLVESFDDPVGYDDRWWRFRSPIRIPYAVRKLLGLPGSENNVSGDVPASVVADYGRLNKGKYKNALAKYNDAYEDYQEKANQYKHIYANAKLSKHTTPEMDDLRENITDCDLSVAYFNDMLESNKGLVEYC